MEKTTFGYIGCGNMGGALATALCRTVSADAVFLTDKQPDKAASLAAALGAHTATSRDIAAQCRYLFLGVKPQVLREALAEIKDILAARGDDVVLVSMAAGVTVDSILDMAGCPLPVIRIMPNTPVSVGEGMILSTANDGVTEEAYAVWADAMQAAGRIDRVSEAMIDAGCAISGCGPAFACLFLEALADGGVTCGLPRDKALAYAAQMLAGTAHLLQESGRHPGELKDAVCSPGGSTIEGVRVLETSAFRAAVTEAVIAAFERTRELGK